MAKRHILFIDPLEKLVFKKDSTLMFALTLKEQGEEVYLLFEEDFYFSNIEKESMKAYSFSGSFEEDGCYLASFEKGEARDLTLGDQDIIHMRIDPPFDTRYLRYLWMLKSLKRHGVEIMNSAEGVVLHNEKLYAYENKNGAESFVGSSLAKFIEFSEKMREKGNKSLILKPLDLYQGIGVEKISMEENLEKAFLRKVEEFSGPVVVQPFVEKVTEGEIRSIYFAGKELGSILKVPPKGEYLANIAQGATYASVELSDHQRQMCEEICTDLKRDGVDWIAFDILGDHVSEVNITCPGLLVEVSKALGRNLAKDIIALID